MIIVNGNEMTWTITTISYYWDDRPLSPSEPLFPHPWSLLSHPKALFSHPKTFFKSRRLGRNHMPDSSCKGGCARPGSKIGGWAETICQIQVAKVVAPARPLEPEAEPEPGLEPEAELEAEPEHLIHHFFLEPREIFLFRSWPPPDSFGSGPRPATDFRRPKVGCQE